MRTMSKDKRFSDERLLDELRAFDFGELQRLCDLLWPGGGMGEAVEKARDRWLHEGCGCLACAAAAAGEERPGPSDLVGKISEAVEAHLRGLLAPLRDGRLLRWLVETPRAAEDGDRLVDRAAMMLVLNRYLTWAVATLLRQCEMRRAAAGKRKCELVNDIIAQMHEGRHPDHLGVRLSFGQIAANLNRLGCGNRRGARFTYRTVQKAYQRRENGQAET
jgi:hypothetical protein